METLQEFLLWSTVINFGMLLVGFIVFTLGKDLIYRFFGKWEDIPKEKFCVIMYSAMTFYKLCILFFNLVPYIVLRIID